MLHKTLKPILWKLLISTTVGQGLTFIGPVYALDSNSSSATYNQCVQHICGGEQQMSPEEIAANLPVPADFDAFWMNVILPKIELLKSKEDRLASVLHASRDSFVNKPMHDLKRADLRSRMVKIQFLQEKFELSEFTESGNSEQEPDRIDEKRLNEALSSVEKSRGTVVRFMLQTALQEKKDFLAVAIGTFLDPLQEGLLPKYLSYKHPDKNATLALEIEIKKTMAIVDLLEELYGHQKFVVPASAIEIKDLLKRKLILSKKEKDLLAVIFIHEPTYKMILNRGFLQNLDRIQVSGKELAEVVSTLKSESTPSKESFAEFTNKCYGKMKLFAASRPTRSEIVNFEGLKKQTQSAASLVAFQLLGDRRISEEINKTRILYPLTWLDTKKRISVLISEYETTLAERTRALFSKEFLSITSILLSEKGNQKPLYENICELSVAFSDHASLYTRDLNLSWVSLKMPKYGVAILAHELSHVLTGHIQSTKVEIANSEYSRRRSCVTERNPGKNTENKDQTFLPNDASHSEEDFADHFQSLVLGTDGPTPPGPNMGCLLLAAKKKDKLHWQGSRSDVHSPPFLRLLLIQADQGRYFPSSCANVISEFRQNAATLRCE